MIKIGLTGSIGSGKSTLARMASEKLGIPVFDADKIVGELYSGSEELKTFLKQKCNDDIIQDGEVNRDVLKAIMQDQSQQATWQEIEAEVHRLVWIRYDEFIAEQEAIDQSCVIADIPLLFEKNSEKHFDYTINVYLPYEQQKQRALERQTPKLTEADFEQRYAAFMPIEKRNQRADFTIDNSGEIAASLLQLRAHIANMHDRNGPEYLPETFNQAAVYVGSFDPMTLGHVDVVKSAAKMPYPKLYVAIGINPAKKPMFSVEERLAMIEREMDRDVRPYLLEGQEIVVTTYEGLTVDFMKKVGSSFCVRGLRGIKDLEEEGDLAAVNRGLYADTLDEPGAESFSQAYFATSKPELRHVSSSFARAICMEGKDLSLLRYVSPDIAAKMIAKNEQKKIMSKMYRIPTPDELDKLKSTWQEFVSGDEEADQIYEELISRYNEPHRAYHNVGHLVELFEYFEEYKSKFQSPQAVALALFFHDVIYDVPGSNNEAQSAEYARQVLAKLNIEPDVISRATDLIEMTQTHQPKGNDPDALLMLDMDMAVLAAPLEQYARYHQAIEAEYLSHFSPEQYFAGRLQFLDSFGQKDRLFLTDEFEEKYGSQAAANIAAEHAQLKERLAQSVSPDGPI